ncbi:MAG: thiamine pyrophosphate-binding protein [Pseudomonadota bacterium]
MSDALGDKHSGSCHGGRVIVDALEANGVERLFCVPGESFLAVLDALHDSPIQTVIARHEGNAAMMAEAHGKLTGNPGIAFCTRGPGATNAASGVHVAFQDSTPMILFIGQVATDQRDREAFQEVDYTKMYAPLAKWVAQIDRTDRILEYLSRAFHLAQSGRPGPVVLALPEDVLSAHVSERPESLSPAVPVQAGATPGDVEAVIAELDAAERPLVIIGGGGWSAKARDAMTSFAEAANVPVAVSFRCQDYMDNRHKHYVGDVGIGINPALADTVRDADLIVALGPRLGEITTSGYTLLTPPKSAQRLVHVHADADELGRVYHPDLPICCRPAQFVVSLADMAAKRPTSVNPDRMAHVARCRGSYDAWQQPQPTPGALKLEQVMVHLNAVLPDNAILTNGAGNYTAWLHRYYLYRGWRTQLAPTSGSMGYGLPAAIAAKLHDPHRTVVCLAGDGCFQMVAQEFATASEHGAAVLVLVANNGMYGTIRMHQQRAYPMRPSGTTLGNPDFAALARAHGGFGAVARTNQQFIEVFDAARQSGLPAIIDLQMDPAALSPKLRLEGQQPGR